MWRPLAWLAVPVVMVVVVGLHAPPAGTIVFGQPDGDLHPYVGTMVVEWEPGRVSKFCSGTLIAPTVFLTAAHSTDSILSEGLGPRAGVLAAT